MYSVVTSIYAMMKVWRLFINVDKLQIVKTPISSFLKSNRTIILPLYPLTNAGTVADNMPGMLARSAIFVISMMLS